MALIDQLDTQQRTVLIAVSVLIVAGAALATGTIHISNPVSPDYKTDVTYTVSSPFGTATLSNIDLTTPSREGVVELATVPQPYTAGIISEQGTIEINTRCDGDRVHSVQNKYEVNNIVGSVSNTVTVRNMPAGAQCTITLLLRNAQGKHLEQQTIDLDIPG